MKNLGFVKKERAVLSSNTMCAVTIGPVSPGDLITQLTTCTLHHGGDNQILSPHLFIQVIPLSR